MRAKARSDWPSLSPDRAHAWTAGSCGYGGRRTRRRAAVGRRAAELQPVQRAAMAYLRAQAPPCSAEQLDAERWESEAAAGEGGGARQTDEACPLLTSPLLRPAMPARLRAGPHELPPLAARASDAAATLRRLLAAPTPRADCAARPGALGESRRLSPCSSGSIHTRPCRGTADLLSLVALSSSSGALPSCSPTSPSRQPCSSPLRSTAACPSRDRLQYQPRRQRQRQQVRSRSPSLRNERS